jgi:excisionase family DNA binding protein
MTRDDQYYTVKEVANTLQINPLTVYEYIRTHQLSAIKLGRYYRISCDDLRIFLEKKKVL